MECLVESEKIIGGDIPVKYPARFTWKDGFTQFFRESHIYLRHVMKFDDVWKRGQRVTFAHRVLAEAYATMPINGFCSIGMHSYSASPLPNLVKVGRFCSIAPGVSIMGLEHPTDRFTSSPVTYNTRFVDLARGDFNTSFTVLPYAAQLPPPEIGHDVWIGEGALLRGGIRIGTGAIIAARAVVTKDVPPYAVVGGVPAKLIRKRFSDHEIERLLASSWWDYNYIDLPREDGNGVVSFLDRLDELKAKNAISPFGIKLYDLAANLRRIENA